MKNKKLKILFFCFCFLFVSLSVFAAETNIDSVYKYAWGEDIGWINFGTKNGGVMVESDKITGYAWSQNYGWINLSPKNGGVSNDGKGNLSGYAWGENLGWINFEGVKIDSDGYFSGYATFNFNGKESKISFNCSNTNSCLKSDFKVKTSWKPSEPHENQPQPVITSEPTQPSPTEPLPQIPPSVQQPPFEQPPQEHPLGPSHPSSGGRPSQPSSSQKVFPTIPLSVHSMRYCDIQKKEVPANEWSEEKCYNWCPLENRYVPPTNFSEEKCFGVIWCESQKKYIPKNQWNKLKCEALPLAKNIIQQVYKTGQEVFENPVVSTTSKTASTAGVSFMILRLIQTLLIFPPFLKRKKVKKWGTVYDSVTKQPLDPAYVVLKDLNGNEVASSFTDIDGRYGFLVDEGKYKMEASKTHYAFPSKRLTGKTKDEIYENLYFGEEFEVRKDEAIIKDIPMDPIGFDWNEYIKKRKNLFRFYSRFNILFEKVSDFLFNFGFILAIFLSVFTPSLFNFIILGLYVFVLLLRVFNIKPAVFGFVMEKLSNFPLSFAIIRVFLPNIDKEVIARPADQYGRYYILVPKGKYYIKVEKRKDDGTYEPAYYSNIIDAKDGVINKKIKV